MLRTVLIVGDDADVAAALRRSINDSGYRSTWVRTGREAIWAMTNEKPTLVVIDLAQDTTGRDLLAKIDRSPALARMPRAVFTERGHVGFASFDEWALLLKPADLGRLLRLMRRLVIPQRPAALSSVPAW